MNKNVLMKMLEEIENDREKQRKIEKISYSQFEKDVLRLTGETFQKEDIKKMYDDLPLPKRGTKSSAGYDFYAPYDFTLEPGKTIIVPTGIKVDMNKDEIFAMYVRSSTGFKFNVRLCNQVGIIDADFYNNPSNEGHIMIAFHNHGEKIWENQTLGKKPEDKSRIAQGIFTKYFVCEDDNASKTSREGGIGSTDK